MEDLNSALWCSVESIRNLTAITDDPNSSLNQEKTFLNSKVFGFGTVACVFAVMIVNVLVSIKFANSELVSYVYSSRQGTPTRKLFLNVKRKVIVISKTLSKVILVLFLLFIAPLTIVFLLSALVYKAVCLAIIKINDELFVKYLDSFDVFWSLEDDRTKSIINVLGVIESKSPYVLANNIKNKLVTIRHTQGIDKLFYRKREKYGFYYWQKQIRVDIDKYVKVIHRDCKDHLTIKDLEDLMTDVESEPLPYDNEGLFQIIITKESVNQTRTENGEYGIIFRIHHSVGDGVALIHFLCGKLADNEEYSNYTISEESHSSKDLVDKIKTLCEIPLCFAAGILRQCDENSIHGQALSGRRLFKWSHSEENLLRKVKELKDKVKGLSFSGILLVALSGALRDTFLQTSSCVPDQVTTVIPIRFPKTRTERSSTIENDFTVAMVNIPIKGRDNVIDEIKENFRSLSASAEPLTNHYLLRAVSVLPRRLLQQLLASRHATLVFSNLRGPARVTLGGGQLRSLVFFVPNNGTTGLGVTALTYGSVLRLGVSADAALLDSAALQGLLDGMTKELCRLHAEWT